MTYGAVIAGGIFGLVCLNWRRPILLRNFFILYTFAIYNLAPLVFGSEETNFWAWTLEYLAVLLVFLAGYRVGRRLAREREDYRSYASATSTRLLEQLFLLGFLFSCAALAIQILAVGPGAWFSGAFLVETRESYGQANVSGALSEVSRFVFSCATVSLLCVLIERRAEAVDHERLAIGGRHLFPLNTLAIAWLIVLPVFALERQMMASGSLVYLAAASFISRRRKRRTLPVLLVGAAFLFSVAMIELRSPDVTGSMEMAGFAMASELSTWISYSEIKKDIGDLHYQYGYRLFVPFALKLVPRGILPDKPYNSGGYFMWQERPTQAAEGFMLAPTYAGDLYLNFGMAGVLFGTVLLGWFSGLTDAIVLFHRSDQLGWFLLVLFNYFSLLRNDLSDSVFLLSIVLLLYGFLRRLHLRPGAVAFARAAASGE